jgi:predicted RNase H-like HicB family nuclease
MHNLLRINEFEVKDRGDYVTHLVEQFSQSLTGYGIDPKKYDELNEAMSPYTKAMFMCFDLYAFAKTINHYLVSMAQAQMMATGGLSSILPSKTFASDDVFAPGEVDLPTEGKYENNQCYKVYGHIQSDNRVEILQVIEEDTSPDDMLIVHDEEDDELEGVISLYTINRTEEEAVINAKIVFEGYIRDMLETDADRALRIAEEMNSSSGLIS